MPRCNKLFWSLALVFGLMITTAPVVAADEAAPAQATKTEDKSPDEAGKESAAADKKTEDKQGEEDYYELFSVLVDTLDEVERNYVKKLSRRELIEAAIEGVLHKLDPYSNYIAPAEINRFRTSVENQFGGIGIQISPDEVGIRVVTPLVGSPAYRAGLEAGDHIVEIEGKSTVGIGSDEAVQKLKGEVGSEVHVTVAGKKYPQPTPITLRREVVHVETVLGERRQPNHRWDYMLDDEAKIAYVRLTGFGRDTADKLKDAIAELTKDGMRGLILDLRFNPGGLLTSAIDICDLFVKEGRIVSTEGRNTEPRAWEAKSEDTFDGFPMVVLVNRYSASSSEIVAACLQDHHRAVVIGERTWGKGSVQNVVELEGGRSALKLTTASYKRPSGKNIHRFPDATEADEWGVVPDEGFAVRLNNDELSQLLSVRHDRDIVPPTEQKSNEIASAPQGEQPAGDAAAPADAKPEEPKPPAAETPSPSTDGEKPAETSDDQSQADGNKPDAAKSDAAVADGAANKPEPAKSSSDKADKFIDRQLAKALEYLRGELAKAQAK